MNTNQCTVRLAGQRNRTNHPHVDTTLVSGNVVVLMMVSYYSCD